MKTDMKIDDVSNCLRLFNKPKTNPFIKITLMKIRIFNSNM